MSQTKKDISGEIESLKSFHEFVLTNAEIAAAKMRRIRDAVIKRRDFITELTALYKEVKRNYFNEISEILQKSKKIKSKDLSGLIKDKKTGCIFVSTNSSLYGDIVKNTYALFQKGLLEPNSEPIIIGKIGKRMFEENNPGANFSYFDYPDGSMDKNLLKRIIIEIMQYEKIVVYHSKFQTLLSQTPTAFIIAEAQDDPPQGEAKRRYIFEPSLDKIVDYFEKEIFSSIFEQTMHESQLSKFASRMVILDASSENIKKGLSKLLILERKFNNLRLNKNQLNSIQALLTRRRMDVK